jgi:hypothetical protein
MAAQRAGREHGRQNVGGTTRKATASRFSSTTIRLPNKINKDCSRLQSIADARKSGHSSKHLNFSTFAYSP